MLAGEGGGAFIRDQRRANAGNLVRRHAHANARRANQDAKFHPSRRHRFRDRLGIIRVVARVRRARADVGDRSPVAEEIRLERLLQLETGVIAPERQAIGDIRARFFVALDWLWSYVTYQRGARLITGA